MSTWWTNIVGDHPFLFFFSILWASMLDPINNWRAICSSLMMVNFPNFFDSITNICVLFWWIDNPRIFWCLSAHFDLFNSFYVWWFFSWYLTVLNRGFFCTFILIPSSCRGGIFWYIMKNPDFFLLWVFRWYFFNSIIFILVSGAQLLRFYMNRVLVDCVKGIWFNKLDCFLLYFFTGTSKFLEFFP